MNADGWQKDSYCSYCGQAFTNTSWPRTCDHCGNTTYCNPLPVAVLLLPVDDGLLVIRRTIEPGNGKLALPGGFIELGESWQEAAGRELHEEAQLEVDSTDITEFAVHSGTDERVMIFGVARRSLTLNDLPPFTPTVEASERLIITEPTELAFPTHTTVVADFFQG